jgi:hypothetical protein
MRMTENNMDNTPKLPATDPETADPATTEAPSQSLDVPLGNAADPTGRESAATGQRSEVRSQRDSENDLHEVGADSARNGSFGKTDVNLGQDAPIDAGNAGVERDKAA